MTKTNKTKNHGGVLFDRLHKELHMQTPALPESKPTVSVFEYFKTHGKLKLFDTNSKGGLMFTLSLPNHEDHFIQNDHGDNVSQILIKMILVNNNSPDPSKATKLFVNKQIRLATQAQANIEIDLSNKLSAHGVSPYVISTEPLKKTTVSSELPPPAPVDSSELPPPISTTAIKSTNFFRFLNVNTNTAPPPPQLDDVTETNIKLFGKRNPYLLLSNYDANSDEERKIVQLINDITTFLASDENHEIYVIYMEYLPLQSKLEHRAPNVEVASEHESNANDTIHSELLTKMFEITQCVHGDYHKGNFIMDIYHKHYIIDFGLARELPQCFVEQYAQLSTLFAHEDLRIAQRFFVCLLNNCFLINTNALIKIPLQYNWIITQYQQLSNRSNNDRVVLDESTVFNLARIIVECATQTGFEAKDVRIRTRHILQLLFPSLTEPFTADEASIQDDNVASSLGGKKSCRKQKTKSHRRQKSQHKIQTQRGKQRKNNKKSRHRKI